MGIDYLVNLLYIFFSLFGFIHIDEPKDIQFFLENQLRLGSACEVSPCLFGQSINGMNKNQVDRIITESSLTERAIFIDGGPNAITWIWTREFAPTMGFYFYQEPLIIDNYSSLVYSGIGFHDDEASDVWFSFFTEFRVLVDLYGEPELVVPATYTRWGTMQFRVFSLM